MSPGNNLALGGNLIHDVAGPAKQNSVFLDVAYRIRTGADTRLSFGLSGGINFFQADLASLSTVEADLAVAIVDEMEKAQHVRRRFTVAN